MNPLSYYEVFFLNDHACYFVEQKDRVQLGSSSKLLLMANSDNLWVKIKLGNIWSSHRFSSTIFTDFKLMNDIFFIKRTTETLENKIKTIPYEVLRGQCFKILFPIFLLSSKFLLSSCLKSSIEITWLLAMDHWSFLWKMLLFYA